MLRKRNIYFFQLFKSVTTDEYYQYDTCTVLFYQLDDSILYNQEINFSLAMHRASVAKSQPLNENVLHRAPIRQ